MSKLIDLTHTFTNDMPVYPGDPCCKFYQIASLEKNGFIDHKVETGLHVGTHMDAPLHMIKGGKKISELPLQNFKGRGHLIDARGLKKIDVEVLNGHDITIGDFLLFLTGFDRKFHDSDYFLSYPDLSINLAKRIVELGVSVIGLDTPSPDREPFPIHKILLGNNILIIENLTNLNSLLNVKSFNVTAYPAKFEADAAPVRVIAEVS